MTFRWTRIHALLGEQPGELAYDHVRRVVEAKLAETDDLDWKAEWPSGIEFSKDVAAMANSGGGLIVCGITESGEGEASGFRPTDWDDAEERRLRAIANSGIHPPVFGLAFRAFAIPDSEQQGFVVALSIPASEDSPHLVMADRRNFIGPYRDGAATHYMNEGTLERAYAERFRRRGLITRSLAEDLEEARASIDLEAGSWLVAASHPTRPLGAGSRPLPREQVTAVLTESLGIIGVITSPQLSLIRELGNAANNPRPGLRRWITETRREGPDALCDFVRVELRHDGSVLLAAKTEGWYGQVMEDKHQLHASTVEAFAIDFMAITSALSRQLGADSARSHRLDVARLDTSRPIGVLDVERMGGMVFNRLHQPDWSRTVRRFAPVTGQTPGALDIEGVRTAAAELALDVLNQFGVGRLAHLPSDS